MSYKDFQAFTAENCQGYKKVYEISIGGFLYLAFLPVDYQKILCISSEYMSIIDSEKSQVTPIDGDYDEIELYWTKIKKHLIIVVMKLTNEETQKIEQLLRDSSYAKYHKRLQII